MAVGIMAEAGGEGGGGGGGRRRLLILLGIGMVLKSAN